MDTTQMGFQVMIPEKAIQERIDKLVMFKLRHEKIQGILGTVVGEQKQQVVDSLKQHVYETMKDDFLGVKDRIIDSYVESKRTQIFLEKKVVAQVEDEMPHEKLNDVLTFLTLFKQAMIVGPTGSGKSTLAKQAANAFKQRFGTFSCNMEASKSELVGFANLNGYITPQFLDFYENGGVFLIDEYDAMSANIAVVLNAAFDRTGQLSVPNRMEKPIAKKHPEFYCILAGNTWGSGSVEFQGREMQDMAFLDRFKLCRVFIDYDQKIEKGIAGEHYTWFKNIRKFFKDYVDGEQFSTRSMYDGSMLLANGFQKKQLLEMIAHHWDSELKDKLIDKVGV
jgi:energy-coupling factor transporter ATP-binding protein EcfA2